MASSPSLDVDYYAILGIQRNDPMIALYLAYMRLAAACHPDKRFYDSTEMPITTLSQSEYWDALNEAFEVLSNPTLKAVYDMHGVAGLKRGQANNQPLYEFSGDSMRVYHAFVASNRSSWICMRQLGVLPASVPPSIMHPVYVTLEQLFYGTRKRIIFNRAVMVEQRTSYVESSVVIDIPPGAAHGSIYVFPKLGHMIGDSETDAIFMVCALPHEKFDYNGKNLTTHVSVTLQEALLGGQVPITCIDGKTIMIQLVEVVLPGKKLVIYGEGMPIPGTNARGDMFVVFTVLFPPFIPPNVKPDLALIFKTFIP